MKTDPKTGLPMGRMPRGKIPHFELIVRMPSGAKISVVGPYTKPTVASIRKALTYLARKERPADKYTFFPTPQSPEEPQ